LNELSPKKHASNCAKYQNCEQKNALANRSDLLVVRPEDCELDRVPPPKELRTKTKYGDGNDKSEAVFC
jgi:hypothetical protein